jgi:hypothetical protein
MALQHFTFLDFTPSKGLFTPTPQRKDALIQTAQPGVE